jgi:hypothetical protein
VPTGPARTSHRASGDAFRLWSVRYHPPCSRRYGVARSDTRGCPENARRPSGQVRSADLQDGHTLKTPSTAIRMATRTAAAPEFPAPATSRFVMLPGALRPEPAGHNCPAPRPNPARPSRQTASCPQTARPARAAGITSRRESWAACRSASASVRTRHCAPTRPPEAAVRGLQNIGYVLCALLRPAIAPRTDQSLLRPG